MNARSKALIETIQSDISEQEVNADYIVSILHNAANCETPEEVKLELEHAREVIQSMMTVIKKQLALLE